MSIEAAGSTRSDCMNQYDMSEAKLAGKTFNQRDITYTRHGKLLRNVKELVN